MKKILLTIFAINTLFGFSQVLTQDSLALVSLYNSTGGSSWSNNTNWLTAAPVSSWNGVTVNGNRVTQIRLNNNNLSGTLPSAIGNLTSINLFFISYNSITGTLPASMSNWSSISRLIVDRNNFSGNIPSFISNLTTLTQLYLSGNNFTGSIPSNLNQLSNLQWLWLDRNQLSGAIPASLMNMGSLEIMGLNNNSLTGNLPSGFANLPNLEYLFVHQNQLSGSVPSDIGSATNLEELWLSENNFSGSIPASTTSLNNLKYLAVNDNNLSGTIPDFSSTMSSLEWVFVEDNNFTAIAGLTNSANLSYYNMRRNRLNFLDLQPIASDLTSFALYSNQDLIDNAISASGIYNATVSDIATSNSYQWNRYGNPISGATNSNYFLFWQSGVYNCTINNSQVPNLTITRRNIRFRSWFGFRSITNSTVAAQSIVSTSGNPSSNGKFGISLIPELETYLRENENDEEIKISVVNQLGQTVYKSDYNQFGNNVIDISNHPNGIYILVAQLRDLSFTTKLVYTK